MTTFNDIKRRLEILCEQWSKPDDAPVPASAYVDCATELALLLADWPATVYREQADELRALIRACEERGDFPCTREAAGCAFADATPSMLDEIDRLRAEVERVENPMVIVGHNGKIVRDVRQLYNDTEALQAKAADLARPMLDEIDRLAQELARARRLLALARNVVRWDWSDNDADCVADVDALRDALTDADRDALP